MPDSYYRVYKKRPTKAKPKANPKARPKARPKAKPKAKPAVKPAVLPPAPQFTPINWDALGAVNVIQDQGKCGSCWAFAAAGTLESVYKIASKSKPLFKFSE